MSIRGGNGASGALPRRITFWPLASLALFAQVLLPQTGRAASGLPLADCVKDTNYAAIAQIFYSELCHISDDITIDHVAQRLPTGRVVRGREHDGCTVPVVGSSWADKPGGFDFRSACDMHDYGYELIRRGLLPKEVERIVDHVFKDTLTHICGDAYRNNSECLRWANLYGDAVLAFNYFNSTAATPDMNLRLPIGFAGLIRSHNYPNLYIKPSATASTLSPAADAVAAGGKFRVVPGLSGTGISLQSAKYPDRYLRHQNYTVKLQRYDGSALFRDDATFAAPRTAAKGNRPDLFSIASRVYPDRYLRHFNGQIEVSSSKYRPGITFNSDASWMLERLR